MADDQQRPKTPDAGDQPPQQAARETTVSPKDDPAAKPTTDNQRTQAEASPASNVSDAASPDHSEAEATIAVLETERLPALEPATDMTGIREVDPTWVHSGYWGPLDESQHPAVLALRANFPDAVESVTFFRDEVTIRVRAEQLVEVCTHLRDQAELRYGMLSDLTAVDMLRLRTEPRFDVVVQLYSIGLRQRLRLKAGLAEDQPCPSLTAVYRAAGWLERECYDMFGITFEGHPDLRRMLLSEDWDEGHPLRKDYPIRGYKQYVQPGFEDAAPRITNYRRN
jgi:NADH-quinone oxidoreductase subunit C